MGWLRAGVLAIAAFLCAATEPAQYARQYPAWVFLDPSGRDVGCAHVTTWVAKSGKTGVGLGLGREAAAGCTVALTSAKLVVGGAIVVDAALPPPADAMYLPFPFDANDAWNKDIKDAVLTLTFNDGTAWSLHMQHQLHGYHTRGVR
jgi:hypothetical protein